ncbi:xanthine phosphoribosyltransferase [Clostridium sp. MSJ-4]|uniref:Xanthine phosphoribosyltransferase n=1 Tax=Clostridium simiarum TaxID=2841506 RepID=A0ABS6EVD7_9CLOT|nr:MULTISPECIES: xanthine phosphoribosyltransferase [Clostridium]MBU5590187.1 xanthine phosphoribosyltransferase [Clostridium simiarum]
MNLLKERIIKDGKVREGRILKVDSFLNHQMDIRLLNEIGKEFKKRFQGEKVDKILTIEASGIGIAAVASQYFDYAPVVFAKKTESLNIDNDLYKSPVHSYTKNKTYNVMVSKSFIKENEKILIIDDFLASGCAACGLIDIATQAKAEVIGVGIVIEKGFQGGREAINNLGVKVESLAIVDKMEEDRVYFK